MERQEILVKAIEKALKGGWDFGRFDFEGDWHDEAWSEYTYEIIFSHEFAKAFWGSETISTSGDQIPEPWEDHLGKPLWKYHLQQMVLEDDPITYLERFIKE